MDSVSPTAVVPTTTTTLPTTLQQPSSQTGVLTTATANDAATAYAHEIFTMVNHEDIINILELQEDM